MEEGCSKKLRMRGTAVQRSGSREEDGPTARRQNRRQAEEAQGEREEAEGAAAAEEPAMALSGPSST
ncbi:hypothetical protein Trco_004124 [Trichoderma cornu-damae]|uniref:Uncharacterized protein n=1 Tax=Trichoderma cornu-damae TaxID=654480 RepID=A0A9P8QK40_9HYPO|nr:hypothetical protein Trco_004124 [Trichoderma cornu-damae]